MVSIYYEDISVIYVTKTAGKYGGYIWNSYADLSIQMGKSSDYISGLMRKRNYSNVGVLLDNLNVCKAYKGICWTTYSDVGSYFGHNSYQVKKFIASYDNANVQNYIDYQLSKRGMVSWDG